jgi:hypothetical protein
VPGRFIGNQKASGQKGCLGLDPSIVISFAIAIEGLTWRVAEKAMCQLVHDVASLPIWMMEVVVHNRPSNPAWDGHSRKRAAFDMCEMSCVATERT